LSEKIELVNEETGETKKFEQNTAKNLAEGDNPWTPAESEESWSTSPVEKIGEESEAEDREREEINEEGLKNWAKGGSWLSADQVSKGDTLAITSEPEMETYEDNEYPVCNIEYNGDVYNLRLNKQNTNNIADEHGWDPESWVGVELKVVSIKDYPNLDAKGMILEPAEALE